LTPLAQRSFFTWSTSSTFLSFVSPGVAASPCPFLWCTPDRHIHTHTTSWRRPGLLCKRACDVPEVLVTYVYMHITYIIIHIYMNIVCVCVCVCIEMFQKLVLPRTPAHAKRSSCAKPQKTKENKIKFQCCGF
jgi:hypothetical protein